MLDAKKLADYVEKRFIPYGRKEKYIKSLSHKKLVKLAVRVFYPHIPLYTAQEAIFEELIARIEKQSGQIEMVKKMLKEDAPREDRYVLNL